MTILEANIYNTLLAIEAEKGLAGIEPCHALVIKDNLRERVEKAIGMPVTPNELTDALEGLSLDRRIRYGSTINDMYAKVIYREILSSL